ncbi:MAG: hypothetical protein HDT44_11020 [Ruminococcaceae bacterium]|nr:hypothetical protein [Oscillospiraceae bacterium]
MVNIKTKIYILGVSAALLLCGCNSSEIGQPDLSADVTSSSITVSKSETEETVKPSESENRTEAENTTETDQTEEPEETDRPMAYIPKDRFEVREYPDDSIVPDKWIPVYSFAEAAQNFHEIVSADVSNMKAADAVIALANKNVIFLASQWEDYFWSADRDNPNYSDTYKNPYADDNPGNYDNVPLYPVILSPEYYTDIQEIFDLGAEIYTDDALNDKNHGYYYHLGKSRIKFVKEDGTFYVDLWLMPTWNFLPFRLRTYIEIVSESEDKCSFIWHTPNWEMLGEPPEEGWEFNYYSCPAEAVYEDGSWRLSEVYVEGYSLREPF